MNNPSIFYTIFNKVLAENSVGTAFGAFGADQMTANQWSNDTYATGDARSPQIIGPVTKRNFPETVAIKLPSRKSKKKS
jgi:hypothetical protein